MSKEKHNPNNLLGEQVKGTENQVKKEISLEENKYVTTPNIVVPFENCIRVQKNYFIEFDEELVLVTKDILISDYGRDAIKHIRKYVKFINEPSHVDYKSEIRKCYNLYRPLSHLEVKGSFENIKAILKHLFRSGHYEMILTYFWVLYMQPKHPLPMIGLVSKNKGTGKTTFLLLLKSIFEQNAKFIDPSDLSGNFNSSHIDKLCILIDEKFNGKDRQADLQKLKKLITGGVQTRKQKHVSDVDADFYGKFVMCSNDDQMMIAIEKENTRFWIIDVLQFEEENLDILEKAKKEIPAFLYFLHHEYKPLPREGRLWFKSELFQTHRTRVLQDNSRSNIAKEITERLTDYFIENEFAKDVKFSANHFIVAFNLKDISVNYLSRVLKDEFDKESKEEKISNPFFGDQQQKRCRCFSFTRDEIIKEKEE